MGGFRRLRIYFILSGLLALGGRTISYGLVYEDGK